MTTLLWLISSALAGGGGSGTTAHPCDPDYPLTPGVTPLGGTDACDCVSEDDPQWVISDWGDHEGDTADTSGTCFELSRVMLTLPTTATVDQRSAIWRSIVAAGDAYAGYHHHEWDTSTELVTMEDVDVVDKPIFIVKVPGGSSEIFQQGEKQCEVDTEGRDVVGARKLDVDDDGLMDILLELQEGGIWILHGELFPDALYGPPEPAE